MMGRRMVVRRRPLLRAAAVGGTFAAGRAMGRAAEQRDSAQAYQDQQIADMQAQQAAAQPPPAPPQAQAQAAGGGSAADQLAQLSSLHQQGALSDEEFAAAKAKVLGV